MLRFLALLLLLTFFNDYSRANDHFAKKEKNQQREVAPEEQKKEKLLAKMGNDLSSGSYRQLFVYTLEKLRNPEFRVGEAENWNNLEKATSPTHEAYTSSSYLPAAKGQKFTVRGERPDGIRVTYLLSLEGTDGTEVKTELIKEESPHEFKKEVAEGPSGVLMKAQANLGRCLGSGDCSALRGSGPALGTIGSRGAGLERLMPGQVLRLSPGAGMSGSMGYFRTGPTGHYIVVESVNPDGTITFLDQNWAGGSSSGRHVRRATANLRTLSGSATIYSGN